MFVCKRIRVFCAVVFAIAVCLITAAAAETEYDGYIVKLSEPLLSTFSAKGGEGIKELEYFDSVYVVDDVTAIEALAAEGLVVYAEPNYILKPLGGVPNDTKYSEQWSLEAIKYSALYGTGYNGEGVTVAVIDSGLDITHPDFKGANISSYSKNFLGDGTYPDAYYRDQLGHGTFVASQIAAVVDNGEGIVGIASGAELMVLRCISHKTSEKYSDDAAYDSGSGSVSVVSTAIRYAVDNGADVINLSLGMTNSSTLLEDAIRHAVANGVIVVASVGNSGGTKMYYPANCEKVIGVASVSRSGKNLVKSSFSQYNTSVDVTAPGGSVLGIQIYPSENGVWYTDAAQTYLTDSGTSYSSPVVAALAAIAKQINPALDSDDFLSLITTTSGELGTAGYDTSYGYGIADAEKLLSALTEDAYSIEYILNDSEDAPAALPIGCADSYKLNGEAEMLLPIPEREGYIFKGWCFDRECAGDGVFALPKGTLGRAAAKISDGEVTGYRILPVSLYAKWGIGSSISPEYAEYDIYTGDDLEIALTMPGNTFAGVFIGEEPLSEDGYVCNNGIVTLNAAFLKSLAIGTHAVRFRFEFGDDAVLKLKVTDSAPRFSVTFYPALGFESAYCILNDIRQGEAIGTLPNAPTLADRRFIGWYLADKTTRITKNTVVSSDLSVYADWVYTGEGDDPGIGSSLVSDVDVIQVTDGEVFEKAKKRAAEKNFAVYGVAVSGYVPLLGTSVNIAYDGEEAFVYEVIGDCWIKTDGTAGDGEVSFQTVSGGCYVISDESLILYGDANADGKLSLVDVLRILKRTVDGSVELDITAADCNGDREITVPDILAALRIVLNHTA